MRDAVGRPEMFARLSESPRRREVWPGRKWRWLLWVPNGCAVRMLLFFPIGTHIIHPGGQYLRHYRIPMPLTWIVFDQWVHPSAQSWVNASPSDGGISHLGVTTLRRKQPISIVTFVSSDTPSNLDFLDWIRFGAVGTSRMELDGNVPLVCWQFLPRSEPALLELRYLLADNGNIWKADCVTSPEVKHGLYAHFIGREEDLSRFYDLVRRVTASD